MDSVPTVVPSTLIQKTTLSMPFVLSLAQTNSLCSNGLSTPPKRRHSTQYCTILIPNSHYFYQYAFGRQKLHLKATLAFKQV